MQRLVFALLCVIVLSSIQSDNQFYAQPPPPRDDSVIDQRRNPPPRPNFVATEPQIITGTIDETQPYVDTFITVDEQAHQTLQLDLTATGGDLDTLLLLVDESGAIIAQNDDRSANDFNAYIEFPQITPGTYRIISTRYGVADGTSAGDFELRIQFVSPQYLNLQYIISDDDLQAAGFPLFEPRPQAEWTILAYYGGDTNLEPGILNDIKEFERAGGSTEAVRVVALVDRHPDFSAADGDWSNVRLYEISPDSTPDTLDAMGDNLVISSEPLADMPDLDTSSGETFAQFLVWGMRHFPAQQYAIALAGHGAGWRGTIADDSNSTTILSLPQMRAALDAARQVAGVERFQLLINDACSMSSVEYHQAMARFFDYSLASPEIIVDPALDMSLLVQTLNAQPDIGLTDLGQRLINTYLTRDIAQRNGADNDYLSNAITDLAQFDQLNHAIEHFTRVVNSDPGQFAPVLGAARSHVYTYPAFLGGEELVDVGNLMQEIIAHTDDARLILAAEDVLRALDDVVAYGDAGSLASLRTTYHNIYFPANGNNFEAQYFDETAMGGWGNMLRNYYNAVTPQLWVAEGEIPFHTPVKPRITLSHIDPDAIISSLSPLSGFVEVAGRNIAHANTLVDYVQADGTVHRLLKTRFLQRVEQEGRPVLINEWRDGVDVREYSWDALLPVVSDGRVQHNELMLLNDSVAALDARYRQAGSDQWHEVTIVFSLEGRVLRVINRAEATNALGVITITPGSVVQTYRTLVGPDDDVIREPGNTYTWRGNGLTWSYQPAPSGEYRIGLEVAAFGGVTDTASVSVRVDNEATNPALRADINPAFLSVMVRPADWTPLASNRDRTWSRTIAPDGRANQTVYRLRDEQISNTNDLNDLINANAAWYGWQIVHAPQPIFINNELALQFDYTYANDAGQMVVGRAFAVFHDAIAPDIQQTGFIYAAETLDNPDLYNADNRLSHIYARLRDTVRFFDYRQAPDNRQWLWHDNGLMRYPVRRDWQTTSIHQGFWTRHQADDGLTFVATAAFPVAPSADDTLAQAANTLFDTYIQTGDSDADIDQNRTLIANGQRWTVTTYRIQRNAFDVAGRLYMTQANQLVYVVWMESPTDADTNEVYAQTLEVTVDGFTIR